MFRNALGPAVRLRQLRICLVSREFFGNAFPVVCGNGSEISVPRGEDVSVVISPLSFYSFFCFHLYAYAAGTHPGILGIVYAVVCFLLHFFNARFISSWPVLVGTSTF